MPAGEVVLPDQPVEFDKTNLPDEIVLSNYFSVRDDKIVSLVIIFNRPPEY